MNHPTIHYLVNGPNPAQGVPIPTRGRPASLVDSMRIVGVDHVDNKPDNWVAIDYKVEDALVRLIQGGIKSEIDLQLAEQAVRAYLLADYLEVYRPIVFSYSQYGVWPHLLPSTNASDFAYELLASIPSRDVLVVTSDVQVDNGIITKSRSGLVDVQGLQIDQLDSRRDTFDSALAHFMTSVSLPLNSYSGVSFTRVLESDTNIIDPVLNRLIAIIDRDWQAKIGPSAKKISGFVLPPLLTAVLHRARNRESIPDALFALRAEFSDIRKYLVDLESEIALSEDEFLISKRIHDFDSLFASVVPSILEDEVYENRRSLLNAIHVLWVTLALSGHHVLATLGTASTGFIQYVHEKSLENNPNAHRVSKSLVAGKLSRSLRVGSMKKILVKHLNQEELKALGY